MKQARGRGEERKGGQFPSDPCAASSSFLSLLISAQHVQRQRRRLTFLDGVDMFLSTPLLPSAFLRRNRARWLRSAHCSLSVPLFLRFPCHAHRWMRKVSKFRTCCCSLAACGGSLSGIESGVLWYKALITSEGITTRALYNGRPPRSPQGLGANPLAGASHVTGGCPPPPPPLPLSSDESALVAPACQRGRYGA